MLANHTLVIVQSPQLLRVVAADVCLKGVLAARDHFADGALVLHADVHMLIHHVADEAAPELDELAARLAHPSPFRLHHVLLDERVCKVPAHKITNPCTLHRILIDVHSTVVIIETFILFGLVVFLQMVVETICRFGNFVA